MLAHVHPPAPLPQPTQSQRATYVDQGVRTRMDTSRLFSESLQTPRDSHASPGKKQTKSMLLHGYFPFKFHQRTLPIAAAVNSAKQDFAERLYLFILYSCDFPRSPGRRSSRCIESARFPGLTRFEGEKHWSRQRWCFTRA